MSDSTTIEVPRDLRDLLQNRATDQRTTLAGASENLLTIAARVERFEQMRIERRASPTDAAHGPALEQAALEDLGRQAE